MTAAGEYVCKNNKTGEVDASANLWHDEVQTPGWTGGGNGGPDGVCHGDTKGDTGKGCDCGHGVSCGGYIWDHRNSSLLRWLTDEYIGGSKLGLGSPDIDGFFLDDQWSSKGPSETPFPCTPRGTGAGRCARLSPAELSDLIDAWKSNMDAVQASIVAQGGYDWQNFRSVRTPQKAACAAFLREACSNGSQVQSSAMQFWLSYEFNADKSGVNLTSFAMDLGVFLAARGPYAWLYASPPLRPCVSAGVNPLHACDLQRVRLDGVRLRLGRWRQDAVRPVRAACRAGCRFRRANGALPRERRRCVHAPLDEVDGDGGLQRLHGQGRDGGE